MEHIKNNSDERRKASLHLIAKKFVSYMSTTVIQIGSTFYAGIPEGELHNVLKGHRDQHIASAIWYTKAELLAFLTDSTAYDDRELLVMTFEKKQPVEKVVQN